MNFFENLDKHSEIYKNIVSKKAANDFTTLTPTEYYRKYYWFLPNEIIDNMDKICKNKEEEIN